MEESIKFTLHWLQYSTAPNVLTLRSKNSQTIKIEFKPAFPAYKLFQSYGPLKIWAFETCQQDIAKTV